MGFWDVVIDPIGSVVNAVTGTTQGSTISTISDKLGGGGSVSGLFDAVTGKSGAASAASAADPFAGQRPQYQDMLAKLMQGQFTPQDPSYAWRFGQGQQAVERSMAAKGMLNSGNFLTALTDYGQGQASTEYANQFSRLARLAGADIGSPSSAAQILAGQQAQQRQDLLGFGNMVMSNSNFGNVLSSAGSWLSNLFSGGSSAWAADAGAADTIAAMAAFA